MAKPLFQIVARLAHPQIHRKWREIVFAGVPEITASLHKVIALGLCLLILGIPKPTESQAKQSVASHCCKRIIQRISHTASNIRLRWYIWRLEKLEEALTPKWKFDSKVTISLDYPQKSLKPLSILRPSDVFLLLFW